MHGPVVYSLGDIVAPNDRQQEKQRGNSNTAPHNNE